jgi:hypothetical protein
MRRSLLCPAFVLGLCLALGASAGPALAGGGGKEQTKTFEICKRGCRYRTIQKAVDGAGSFKAKNGNSKRR